MLPAVLLLEGDSWDTPPGLLRVLECHSHCERSAWQNFAPRSVRPSQFHLIVAFVDRCSEGMAAAFFQWLLKNPLPVSVLTILPESIDQELLQTVVEVADDFLFWPVREEELEVRLTRILALRSRMSEKTRQALQAELARSNLVGSAPSFLQALEQVALFAANKSPVLITGETGTGKELFAHAIHSLSGRKNGPFVPVDCSALPEQLAESELFGHCRGAFTDAHSDRKGLAALAESGTLFLDEIDALSLTNQAKLLRFLQEGTYRSLGTDRFNRANVRVIAASNLRLEESVRERRFRSDLYFRVNVLRLHLPPLRERRGDIPVLAQHFLNQECADVGGPRKTFSSAAVRKLQSHFWPGNVRELLNTVQRAVVCCRGPQIRPVHICPTQAFAESGQAASAGSFRAAKQSAIEHFEQEYVEELLAKHAGNITRAAREARKERRAFGKLVKKYGIMQQRSA